MTKDAEALRSWLLRQPRPALVRLTTEDRSKHEIKITGQPWAGVAESLCALGPPALIEALDADGHLIRARGPLDVDDEDDEDDAPEAALDIPSRESELVTFARLLSEAYRHSTDVAFERLASLFEAVNRRSEALERSLDTMNRLMRRELDERLEELQRAQDNADPLSQLATSFLGGAAAAQPPPPAPPAAGHKPNGRS